MLNNKLPCAWRSLTVLVSVAVSIPALFAAGTNAHPWQIQEITLRAAKSYSSPYTDVMCWVQLKGPGFSERIYGFWDGGNVWRVRMVATGPGRWTWTSGSDSSDDNGLNGKSGSFTAENWSEGDKEQNPNRHGFLRPTSNHHALQYADGTPFFLLGDTWIGGATWRLPLTGAKADPSYEPGPGITFENAVQYRKRQGFNSVSMIAAFPTWASDQYPSTYADEKGIYYRNAWEKFGITTANGKPTAKDMHDDRGYRPFEILPNRHGLPNYDAIVPEYFQSVDRKVEYLNEQGFIAMLETTRRDTCPPWKAYFNFNESYARFVQYMVARYGAFNIIFSKIHLDIAPKLTSLTPAEFNEALNYHLKKYGPMPYGQPVTSLIDHSTYTTFGHTDKAPWITLHSVGNRPRNNAMYPALEDLFRLPSPNPAVDLEPYYSNWDNAINKPAGEHPAENSDRDNYFARSMMYGCVLSGGLVGHVYGHGAYDVTTTDEPAGARPYIWTALKYTAGGQMQWMKKFFLSEGRRYQDLLLASDEITPRKAPDLPENGLDGLSLMMRTKEKDLAFLYFENKAVRASLAGWTPDKSYRLSWYDPRKGEWVSAAEVSADAQGVVKMPQFPGGADIAETDWAAKLVLAGAKGTGSTNNTGSN